MKRLTATYIEGLKTRDARYEIGDPAVPGLQLRVEPNGAKHWQLRFYWNGKRQKLALGTYPAGRTPGMSLEEARTAALKAREHLDAGIDPRRADRTKHRGVQRRRLRRADGQEVGERTAAGQYSYARFAVAMQAPEIAAAMRNKHSVAYLAHEFITIHVAKRRKHPEEVERFLVSEVLPAWGTRDARTIKAREVVELLDGIVARGAPAMANRGANMLSQMFRFGIQRAICEDTPVQLLYRPGGEEKPRKRTLRDEEIRFLLNHWEAESRYQTGDRARSARTANALRLLLLTAVRRGELVRATWANVHLEEPNPYWLIPDPDSKTEVPYTVPLTRAAVAEFKALKKYAGSSPFVFPSRNGKSAAKPAILTRAVRRNFKRMNKKAAELGVQLEPFTPHDLRRTARTGFTRIGISRDLGERLLNHKLPGVQGVYDLWEMIAEKREALEHWAKFLQEIAAGIEHPVEKKIDRNKLRGGPDPARAINRQRERERREALAEKAPG